MYIINLEINMEWSIEKKRRLNNDNDNKVPRYFKTAKLQLPEDHMIYAVGNEIHFTAEINKDNIEKMIKQITKIIEKNGEKYSGKYRTGDDKLTIAYIVDSPGGCVSSVLKFVDFIQMVKEKHPYVEFISIITGLVASAGTIMCIVADKRMMTKNAYAMIHELSSGRNGKYTHLMSYSEYLCGLHNTLLNIYLNGSPKSKEDLEKILNTESWFNAEQYLANGFVDEIK